MIGLERGNVAAKYVHGKNLLIRLEILCVPRQLKQRPANCGFRQVLAQERECQPRNKLNNLLLGRIEIALGLERPCPLNRIVPMRRRWANVHGVIPDGSIIVIQLRGDTNDLLNG